MINRHQIAGSRGWALALVCVTAALTGCGGTDDGGTTTDSTASQAPAATGRTEAGATGGTASSGGEGSAAPAAQSATVDIATFDYAPKTITVKAGGSVTWMNSDNANHTATQSPGGSGFDTGTLGQGDSKTVTFKQPGSFQYICLFHAFMHGTVEVVK